jgi:6-phosphogluconolactonase (cycloisomerase 2 family)
MLRHVRSEDFLRSKLLTLTAILAVTVACSPTTPAHCAESRELLYVETPKGAVASCKIERDGALTLVGTLAGVAPPARFSGPPAVSLVVQPGGRFAYSTGSSFTIMCYSLDPNDGRLVPNPAACAPPIRIEGGLTMSPQGRVLYAAAYNESPHLYAVDQATGRLTKVESKPAPGTDGKLVLTQSGKFAYVVHSRSNYITSYRINGDGSMRLVSGMKGVPTGDRPVDMAVDPGGNFAYAVNSFDDTISEYFIDPGSGALRINPKTPTIGTGSVPNAIVIDGSGRFLYCTNSNGKSINQYRIESDGSLTLVGVTNAAGIGVGFMVTDPAGKFIYLQAWVLRDDTVIIGYRIAGDGSLIGPLTAPIPVLPNAPGYTPAASWIGSRPNVQIAKRDVTPLMRMETSVAGTFTETGRMTPPGFAGGTLLPDGRLFLPEEDGQRNLHGEIYDPRSGTFTHSGIVAKRAHPIARLMDGRFLIQFWPASNLVSILDPAAMKVTANGHFKANCHYEYWLLRDGRVLFPSTSPFNDSLGCEGEIYDPSTGQSVDEPKALSDLGIVAVLADGRLLLLKRSGVYEPPRPTQLYTYDLVADRIVPLGDFPSGFALSPPIVLKDGTVLIVSRNDSGFGNTAELFDPRSSKFIALGPLVQTHGNGFSLTLLSDGKVLLSGGEERSNAELFDPRTRKFTPTGTMTTVRGGGCVIVVLSDGSVLFAGGDREAVPSWTGPSSYDTAEIYHPPADESPSGVPHE